LNARVEDAEVVVGSTEVTIILKLSLEFRNNGSVNVIFLNDLPQPQTRPIYSGMRLMRRDGLQQGRTYLAEGHFGDSGSGQAYWTDLKERIDTPAPSSAYFAILSPDQFIVLKDTIEIGLPQETKNENHYPERESWEYIKKIPTDLRVIYEVWADGLETRDDLRKKNAKFGLSLQRRWKEYGYLWLDTVISEPIPLDLSSVVTKTRPAVQPISNRP